MVETQEALVAMAGWSVAELMVEVWVEKSAAPAVTLEASVGPEGW